MSATPRYSLLIVTDGRERKRPYPTLVELRAAYKREVAFWYGGNRLNMNGAPRIYGIDNRNGEKVCG